MYVLVSSQPSWKTTEIRQLCRTVHSVEKEHFDLFCVESPAKLSEGKNLTKQPKGLFLPTVFIYTNTSTNYVELWMLIYFYLLLV